MNNYNGQLTVPKSLESFAPASEEPDLVLNKSTCQDDWIFMSENFHNRKQFWPQIFYALKIHNLLKGNKI